MSLRGYDSYRVSLGDEMRGERASLGKSLLDVQRDLRIKAAHIDAIENSNPEAVPYKGFLSGYVRAYARYLGMDEDMVLRRFCEESGFDPGASAGGLGSGAAGRRVDSPGATMRPAPKAAPGRRDDLDALISGSRLAAASRSASLSADFGSTIRGVASFAVMLALVGGIGYGGWALLENIQRVDFAPAPQAPEALATPPDLDAMTRIARAGAVPAPTLDAAALAAVYAMQEVAPPRLEPRDGPISALDPARSGVYGGLYDSTATVVAADTPPLDPPLAAALAVAAADAGPTVGQTPADASEDAMVPRGVALVTSDEAWVRVRNATGGVVHEALMKPGASWRAPEGAEGLTLRAGNAGGVFIDLDGARYGPLGRPGGVVSNILLDAEAVRRVFPRAAVGGAAATVDAAPAPGGQGDAVTALAAP